MIYLDPVYTVPDLHGHDIILDSLTRRMWLLNNNIAEFNNS